MINPAPLYIVASPHQRVGKTLIARLLIDFFHTSGRAVEGYDLHPREPALAERFPHLVWPIDVGCTRGQMQLFDRLLEDDSTTKVIDLGCDFFDQFFAVMQEISFVTEARQRSIEPIVLFVTDPETATIRTYAELRYQLKTATFVPVHNQAVSIKFAEEDFPPTWTEWGVIRISRLSPLVRRVIDWPDFSFGAYMTEQPDGATQVHQWISPILTSLRQIELQLIMERLTLLLGGSSLAQNSASTAE
jgi:hypothetical protein